MAVIPAPLPTRPRSLLGGLVARPARVRAASAVDRRAVLLEAAWGVAVLAGLVAAVVGFSGGWPGDLVVDGPGLEMWAGLAHEYLADGGLPWWMPEMWAGAPVWALAPTFPHLALYPLVAAFGPEEAVKASALASQVAGGLGAHVLVRSLWPRARASAAVAAVLYALHPLVVAHLGLFGLEQVGWVIAAAPWFAWALPKALRGDGVRWVAASALISAFALLMQAEHAYFLVGLGAALLVARLAGPGADGRWRVLGRGAAVVGGTLMLCATWLLPLFATVGSFALTSAEEVRFELFSGTSADFGQLPQTFVSRGAEIADGRIVDLVGGGAFYLGLVPLLLGAAGLPWLRRRDPGGTVTATLVAGTVAVWLCTAGTPLAASVPAVRDQVAGFAVVGALAGLLAAAVVGRLRLARFRAPLWVAAVAALALFPYVAPYPIAQRVLPLLDQMRFSRLYPLAVLAVVLAAAAGMAGAERWLRDRDEERGRLAAVALGVALVGLLLVDLAPYRGYYTFRLRDAEASSLAQVTALLAEGPPGERVGTQSFGEPHIVRALLDSGRELGVGWPHPFAGDGVWRVTGATQHATREYALRAQGLAGVGQLVSPAVDSRQPYDRQVGDFVVADNPHVQPLARNYDQVVVVEDPGLAAELAIALNGTGVGVVTGGTEVAGQLGALPRSTVPAGVCGLGTIPDHGDALVADEVARACALSTWMGLRHVPAPAAEGEQAVSTEIAVTRSGLSAVLLNLDRPPGPATLSVRLAGADGRAAGPELAGVTATATDANGLWRFAFDPVAGSAGRRYVVALSCGECGFGGGPRLRLATTDRAPADVTVDGQPQPLRAMLYPEYRRVAPAPGPPVPDTVTREAPSRWTIATEAERPRLLVLAVGDFPGWVGRLDGERFATLRADGGFLAMPVPPGAHTVDFTFETPPHVGAGRGTSRVAALAALALLCVPARRPRALRPPPPATPRRAGAAGARAQVWRPPLQGGGRHRPAGAGRTPAGPRPARAGPRPR